MKFDKKNVLTAFDVEEAKKYIKKKVWLGNCRKELITVVENNHPNVLVSVNEDPEANCPFFSGSMNYKFMYPALDPTYEELQAEWVKKTGLKVGDKVMVVRSWEGQEKGFGPPSGSIKIGRVVTVSDICSDSIYGDYCYLPYFAIEKVLEPTYRPFKSAEEFEPHRERWICRKDIPGVKYKVISTHIFCIGLLMPTKPGGYYPEFDELFKNWTFEDGTPCGIQI